MFVNLAPKYGLNYKAGQVYFTFNSKNIVSKGVSYFTYDSDDEYQKLEVASHCGICIGEGKGISALNQGIAEENLYNIFEDTSRRIFFKEPKLLDSIGSRQVILLSKMLVGLPYDWRLASGFAICNSFPFRLLFTEEKRKEFIRTFKTKGKFICSEFVMFVLNNCGMTYDTDHIRSPHEVFNHNLFKTWKKDLTLNDQTVIIG